MSCRMAPKNPWKTICGKRLCSIWMLSYALTCLIENGSNLPVLFYWLFCTPSLPCGSPKPFLTAFTAFLPLQSSTKWVISIIFLQLGIHTMHPWQCCLCNLVYEQAAQQIIILLYWLWAHSLLGTAIKTLIQIHQLWASLCQHILTGIQPCPWIPDHWLSHMHATMHTTCTQICYILLVIQLIRINGHFLMEDFIDQDLLEWNNWTLVACTYNLQHWLRLQTIWAKELLPQVLTTSHAHPFPKGSPILVLPGSHGQMFLACPPHVLKSMIHYSHGLQEWQLPLTAFGCLAPSYALHHFWHYVYNTTHLV